MTYTSREYAIKDLSEAKSYLKNDTLRMHLLELCDALLSLETNDAGYVMGYPDGLKLRFSMTVYSAPERHGARSLKTPFPVFKVMLSGNL